MAFFLSPHSISSRSFADFDLPRLVPAEFPSVESAFAFITEYLANPTIWGGVAVDESDQPIGINFILSADGVGVIGPIAIDTKHQGKGIGRALMVASMDYVVSLGVKTFALTQLAHNTTSLPLYLSLGFDIKYHAIELHGFSKEEDLYGLTIAPLTAADLPEVDALHRACLNGLCRHHELLPRLKDEEAPPFTARDSNGVLIGYTSGLQIDGHIVSKTLEGAKALINGVSQRMKAIGTQPMLHVISSDYPELMRWCLLKAKLRVEKQIAMMWLGEWEWKINKDLTYCPGVGY